ncbi:hypothetical protein [Neotabrizicola shimadae]|uniref:Uncharacterized protein n=1 Tax=Neotabrizicola shimadae TaxID=2807096 RepID=A0A8G1ED70_9RHOB|nr:hypothetical protein [Neotabrizicola shimadae]QYZ71217.1 hypothetical protein JO391_06850 [Neotabrizicola shimadae]
MLTDLAIWQVVAGLAGSAAITAGAYIFQRLVAQLDQTADKLGEISTVTAAHAARLDALERVK